jgi:hypothetical protein
VRFKSNSKLAPAPNKIVPPAQGGADDPRNSSGLLTVYNSGGGSDFVSVPLPASKWAGIGLSGYSFSDPTGPIQRIIVKKDSIIVKGGKAGWTYSLNEPSQGHVAVRLLLGNVGWCADAPAKTSGNPPSTAKNDHVDRFVAQSSPAPAICP